MQKFCLGQGNSGQLDFARENLQITKKKLNLLITISIQDNLLLSIGAINW